MVGTLTHTRHTHREIRQTGSLRSLISSYIALELASAEPTRRHPSAPTPRWNIVRRISRIPAVGRLAVAGVMAYLLPFYILDMQTCHPAHPPLSRTHLVDS